MSREKQITDNRIRKIGELREKGINPYPNKFNVKDLSKDLQVKYKSLQKDSVTKDKVSIAGRVMIKRDMGKISFGTLQDRSGRIQIISQEGETSSKGREMFKRYVDSGDFVGVVGKVIRTL